MRPWKVGRFASIERFWTPSPANWLNDKYRACSAHARNHRRCRVSAVRRRVPAAARHPFGFDIGGREAVALSGSGARCDADFSSRSCATSRSSVCRASSSCCFRTSIDLPFNSFDFAAEARSRSRSSTIFASSRLRSICATSRCSRWSPRRSADSDVAGGGGGGWSETRSSVVFSACRSVCLQRFGLRDERPDL